jgi:hypothetical protein
MRSAIRDAASAIITAVVIAIAVDVLLQFLTTSIRITGGIRPPWWARPAAHSVWIVVGLILWVAAPAIAHTIEDLIPAIGASRPAVWALIGTALLIVPPVWVAAQLAILAVQLTLSATWNSESSIFMSGAYYGSVLLTITPWMAAGAILRAYTTHLID